MGRKNFRATYALATKRHYVDLHAAIPYQRAGLLDVSDSLVWGDDRGATKILQLTLLGCVPQASN
jgi:hypothetical protein